MAIIDIDTEFTVNDVQRALSHLRRGLKAVWGIYPKKQEDGAPCLNTWPEVKPPDEYGLVEVRRAGRGFLFVQRDVFEALKEENGGPAQRFHNHGQVEWAFFHSGVVDDIRCAVLPGEDEQGFKLREWISEDWMFCEDIRIHLGIPTLVDTGITLAHIGPKTYRFPQERLVRTDHNITSWQEIHGWFDYEELYRMLAKEIPDGGRFAEVGCWLGKSLAAFDSFVKEARKTIQLVAVDTFTGKPANATHEAILFAHGGSVEKAFRANMEALGVRVGILALDSARGALYYPDRYFDAVFIDADHSYENVKRDIHAWQPKMKRGGGILCGHDYDEPGVKQAVNEFFGNSDVTIETVGRCWMVRL